MLLDVASETFCRHGGSGRPPARPSRLRRRAVILLSLVLELQYAEVIRDLHQQVCSADGQSRLTLENAMEDYQRRYRELTGRLPNTRCARFQSRRRWCAPVPFQ